MSDSVTTVKQGRMACRKAVTGRIRSTRVGAIDGIGPRRDGPIRFRVGKARETV